MKKYLITHEAAGTKSTNAVIISDHCDRSLSAYYDLAQEITSAFDSVGAQDVDCLAVQKSSWCKNCTAVIALVKAGTTKDGWTSLDGWPDLWLG